MPLSRRRAAERGYNQAQVVAQALADFHRLRDAALLTRSRHTVVVPPEVTVQVVVVFAFVLGNGTQVMS